MGIPGAPITGGTHPSRWRDPGEGWGAESSKFQTLSTKNQPNKQTKKEKQKSPNPTKQDIYIYIYEILYIYIFLCDLKYLNCVWARGPAPPPALQPHIYICGDIYIYIYVQVICFIYRSQGLFLINFFKPTSPTKNPLGETVVHETPAVIVERSPLVSPSCGGPPRSIPRDGVSSTPALLSPRPWPSRPPEDKKKKRELLKK